MDRKIKLLTNCYLYNKTDYTETLTTAIMKAPRIEKNSEAFIEDIALEIKRSKVPPFYLKVLTSENTILLNPTTALPKPMRVFCAKDPKSKSNAIKVFIDISSALSINKGNGRYKINPELVIANLIDAKTWMIYHNLPNAYTKNAAYVLRAARVYAKLFTHVIDYLGNISVIPEQRQKCLYFTSKFFLHNILVLTNEDRIEQIATKIADINGTQAELYNMAEKEGCYENIKTFVEFMGDKFKLPKLTVTIFVSKWMYLFGSSTMLALEFFPSFVAMITYAYSGVFFNNQKSIEKIISTDLVEFGKENIYDNGGIL